MKRIMAIIITLVLIVVGGINGLAYAKSTQEPMIGQKLIGWGDLGSLLDIVQANFSVSFTNPDSVSEISIDQVSIIRGDGEVIFEGKLSELPFPNIGDVLEPHQTGGFSLFLCMPDGNGGWLSPGDALALPIASYTVEIFYSVSHKNGLPLIGQTEHQKGPPGAMANTGMVPMVNLEQVLLPEEEKPKKWTLRIASADFGVESTDPVDSGSFWGRAMYDSLLSYDSEGHIIPAVAKSYEISPDGNTWTFYIRKGIKFHNGDPLTAHDVKFSVDRFGDTSLSTNPWSPYLSTGYNKVSSRVVNEYTFEYVTDHPEPALVVPFTQVMILPKNYYEQVGMDEFRLHPIGSGPWKFVEHIPGTSFEMEANKKYWGKVPHFKYVLDILVPEEAARIAMFKAGEVDIINGLSMGGIVSLQYEGYSTVEIGPPIQANISFQGTWLPNAGATGDIRVRQAMSYAIDRQTICDSYYHGNAEPGGWFFMHPGCYGWDDSWLPDEYNPTLAAQLLTAAGYPGEFPDPIIHLYVPEGQALNFLLVCQPYWDAAGIQTQIEIVDSTTYLAYIFSPDRMTGGEPNVGWVFPWVYESFFNSTYHAANMYCSWGIHNTGNDPVADELYLIATTELDPVLAEQYYTEFQNYAKEEMWVNVGVCMIDPLLVIGPRVGNFTSKNHMSLYDALAGIKRK